VVQLRFSHVVEVSAQILSVKLMEMATTSILMNVVADSLAVEASEQI
jgi:hypothetical protein